MKHNNSKKTNRHFVENGVVRSNVKKENNSQIFYAVPKKALILSMLFMLVFGFISTTFAAYFASISNEPVDNGSLVGSIRTAKIEKDNKDADISSLGANADIAQTGISDRYYAGDAFSAGWTPTKMTVHTSKLYSYAKMSGFSGNKEWKLLTNTSWTEASFTLDQNFLTGDGPAGSNKFSLWGSSGSNRGVWRSSDSDDVYLMYYPDGTAFNQTGKDIVSASTTLPTVSYDFSLGTTRGSTTRQGTMTVSGSTATFEVDLNANTTYYYGINRKFATSSDWFGNTGTMTKDNCSNWQFDKGAGDCGITTKLAGKYKFEYTLGNLTTTTGKDKMSVTYPTPQKYSWTASVPDGNGTLSSESGTVDEGESVTITASPADEYYLSGVNSSTGEVSFNGNTITFKPSANNASFTATFSKYIYAIRGINSWNVGDDIELSSDGTATVSINDTNVKNFKIVKRKGNTVLTYYGTTDSEVTRSSCTNKDFSVTADGEQYNGKFNPDTKGSYIFSFNKSTKKLSVTYPPKLTIVPMTRDGVPNFSEKTAIVDYCAYNSSYEFTAPTISEFTFKGWSTTKYTDQQPTYEVTDSSFTISNVTSNITYYAYYTKDVSVTVSPTSKKIALGESVTLTATPSGGTGSFTYAYKKGTDSLSTSNPATISGSKLGLGSSTVTVTATSDGLSNSANSTITVVPNTPTISTFTYPSNYVGGNSAISPTVETDCVNKQVLSYEITDRPQGASTGDSRVESDGKFYAEYPGVYTVKVTCVDRYTTASGTDYDSDSTSETTTIVVKPKAPTITQFTYTEYKVGGNSIFPSKQISVDSSYGSSYVAHFSYSIVGDVPSGTDYTLDANTGAFFTNVPGDYTIKLTVYITFNGQDSFTDEKNYKIVAQEATKYTVNLSKKTRNGSAVYGTSDPITPTLTLSSGATTTTVGTIQVTEGNTVTLKASAETSYNGDVWAFRGFMLNGNVSIPGTQDGDEYVYTSNAITGDVNYYACYSPKPKGTCNYSETVPGGADDNFTASGSATGGNGTYYYKYIIYNEYDEPVRRKDYSTDNFNVSEHLQPGKYRFTYYVMSDKVTENDSCYQSETIIANSVPFTVNNPKCEITCNPSYSKGFISGGGFQEDPYYIYIGGELTLSPTASVADAERIEYSFNDSEYSTDDSITYTVTSVGNMTAKITMKYLKDGVWSDENTWTNYFFVYSTFDSGVGLQKIYQTKDWLFRVTEEADDGYQASLYYSNTNNGDYSLVEKKSFTDLIADFSLVNNLRNGINYFRTEVTKAVDSQEKDVFTGYNYTYIGSDTKSGTKPVYFKNNTTVQFTDEVDVSNQNVGYRLMVQCGDNWITMDRLGETNYYRAYVPSNSTNATFRIMYANKYSRTDASDFAYASTSSMALNTNNLFNASAVSGGNISGTSGTFSGIN